LTGTLSWESVWDRENKDRLGYYTEERRGIVFMNSGATSTDGLLQRWRNTLFRRVLLLTFNLDNMEQMRARQ
jgi:hypothetical protein